MNTNTNTSSLISIIVPVYNVEKYLSRCIDSLLAQTYPKIEIILIDDGSTDSSGIICDQYCCNKNIRVIHQKNKGLSGARNTGINEASGEFITFVDSDDFVANDYVEYLYSLIVNYHADMAICSNCKFFEKKDIELFKQKNIKIKLFSSEEALENMLYRKGITAYACGKLYRTTHFGDVFFPENKLFEDLSTTYKLIDKCQKICWSSAAKYYYFQRENSIVNSKFDRKKLHVLEAGFEINRFIIKYYPDIENAVKSKIFVSAVDLYRKLPIDNVLKEEKIYLDQIIRKYRKDVFRDKKNKWVTRVMAFVACINISLLRLICLVYTVFTEKFHIYLKSPI